MFLCFLKVSFYYLYFFVLHITFIWDLPPKHQPWICWWRSSGGPWAANHFFIQKLNGNGEWTSSTNGAGMVSSEFAQECQQFSMQSKAYQSWWTSGWSSCERLWPWTGELVQWQQHPWDCNLAWRNCKILELDGGLPQKDSNAGSIPGAKSGP